MLRKIQVLTFALAVMLAKLAQLPLRLSKRIKNSMLLTALIATAILAGHTVSAQVAAPPSLKTVAIPEPDNLTEFVKDKTAAIALGKTLFWDMQVGRDGIQACASCHFHAGADNRSKNQINSGTLRVNTNRSE